jgi:hypothetical protein
VGDDQVIYREGIDIIVVGYHQPVDSREFHSDLLKTSDTIPWDATYVSVEANDEDMKVGDEVWGERHFPVLRNVGHAGACNAAAPLGGYDTILFANADARITDGSMDHLHKTLWSDERFGVIGPRQVDESGQITAAGIFGSLQSPAHRGWHHRTNEYRDLRTDAVMTSGALYMIKRHVWDTLADCPIFRSADPEAKGAMPSVRHYYSDAWPSYHMTAHGPEGGWLNVFDGRVTCRHDWHKSHAQGSWADQQMARDKAHFQMLCRAHNIVTEP